MKQIGTRVLSALLAGAMAISLAVFPAGAEAGEDTLETAQESVCPAPETQQEDTSETSCSLEVTYVNPVYESVVDESELTLVKTNEPMAASNTYYTTVEEVGEAVRGYMKDQVESFQIKYQSNVVLDGSFLDEVLDVALAHTGDPTEGDYLKYQYGTIGLNGSYTTKYGGYYYTLTLTVVYYTTLEQEAELDQAVDELFAQWDFTGKSNAEIIQTIYDEICNTVTYDYTNLNDDSYKLKYTAYGALINHTSVCQGYAVLLYRLLETAGVDCRVITGTGNGGAHAWNIAKIGNLYYNLDATWDAGRNNYSYFLTSDAEFGNHQRGDAYTTDTFYAQYPMSQRSCVIGTCGDQLTWTLDGDGVITISGTGEMTDFDWGCTPWNVYREIITACIVQDGVTCIGQYAFIECDNLVAIRLPESVTSIHQGAFTGCFGLEEISIPSGVITIGTEAFDGCISLKSVALSEGLRSIEQYAFNDCSELTELTIPASVTEIGTAAFGGETIYGYSGTAAETYALENNISFVQLDVVICTHIWDDGVISVAATCVTDGMIIYTCSLCGETYQDLIPATGVHTYDSGVVTKTATCTETGVKTYTCTLCQTTKTETIAAKGHTEVTDEAVAATCTETGLTQGSHCSVCGTVLTKQETVPATGVHTYDSGVVTKAATCTITGVKTYTCTLCQTTKTETIAAKGHTAVTDEAVAATCTETGLAQGSHCSVCGTVLTKQETVPATGHTEVVDKAVTPTSTRVGKTEGSHCSVCGEILVAQKDVYKISYVLSKGTNDSSNPTTYVAGEKTITLAAPTKTGYTFSGWYNEAGKKVTKITKSTTGNQKLTAKWTANTYTVKFKANGGTGTMSAMTGMEYGTSFNLTANAFKRTGYTFAGWNTKADGSGTSYSNQELVKNLRKTDGKTITLYAQWEPITYTVKFKANGGTGTMSAMTGMKYGTSFKLTSNAFKRTGYTFVGWNTKADGSGTSYSNKELVKNLRKTDGKTITLYAQWKKK